MGRQLFQGCRMHRLLNKASKLDQHIVSTLYASVNPESYFPKKGVNLATASAVLFLLGKLSGVHGNSEAPCLILNKRSSRVKQPGDLCCPGGGVTPRFDRYLAKLAMLPFLALRRWRYWSEWRRLKPRQAHLLALFWATGLRESFEEMRLNPFGVKFLGLLPSQSLVMFDRVIYPMVAWVKRQVRFSPNWEVEKIVYIPLRDLLNSENYARYRLNFNTYPLSAGKPPVNDFPCFIHQTDSGTELLWGATYRIAAIFLDYIFDFKPPDLYSLPVVNGSLSAAYLTGQ